MKTDIRFLCGLLCLPLSLSAAAVDIVAPAKRAETVALSKRLLNPEATAESGTPFNPFTLSGDRMEETNSAADTQAANLAAVMASNRTLLVALADQLDPKGTFVIGGESIIILGQKKLKVGETYSITFEGAVYELEITSIETTRFSVRYKNEEITRPIVITKSGK
jgi:hypothetical protein